MRSKNGSRKGAWLLFGLGVLLAGAASASTEVRLIPGLGDGGVAEPSPAGEEGRQLPDDLSPAAVDEAEGLAEEPQEAPAEPRIFTLGGPDASTWEPVAYPPGSGSTRSPRKDWPLRIHVTDFEVPVLDDLESPSVVGWLREGTRVAARATELEGCKSGSPLELAPGGAFVCPYKVALAPIPGPARAHPDPELAVPFRFVRVIEEPAARLLHLPSSHEAPLLERSREERLELPGLVEEWLVGDYFLAITQEVETDSGRWLRTVHDRWVDASRVKEVPPPRMHGEILEAIDPLPLAFVIDDEVPLLCRGATGLGPCGQALKHHRFAPGPRVDLDGSEYVSTPEGALVPLGALRIVERSERPEGVGEQERWLHIDLAHQTLVAYEGDVPVFATLVSSGRDGYHTPTGLYRVQRKYQTKTMRGVDRDNGRPYEVQEVPWTMYYRGNYAVHGAYWHSKFGRTKSHGCTNLAPADARFVYQWTSENPPTGWHARVDLEGTWFYFTGESPADGA